MLLEKDGITCYYDSSNILVSQYDKDRQELYLTFNSGGLYKYENINESLNLEFENSESQGKFFIDNIKNKHQTTKIMDVDKNNLQGLKQYINKNLKKM